MENLKKIFIASIAFAAAMIVVNDVAAMKRKGDGQGNGGRLSKRACSTYFTRSKNIHGKQPNNGADYNMRPSKRGRFGDFVKHIQIVTATSPSTKVVKVLGSRQPGQALAFMQLNGLKLQLDGVYRSVVCLTIKGELVQVTHRSEQGIQSQIILPLQRFLQGCRQLASRYGAHISQEDEPTVFMQIMEGGEEDESVVEACSSSSSAALTTSSSESDYDSKEIEVDALINSLDKLTLG